MSTVVVNGDAHPLPPGTTVAELLAQLGVGPAGVAVARNGEVVVRSAWATTTLAEGDRVEVLAAAQGG